jgi:chromate reductase, NAD(P)H dehydrogenase (quinone)
METKLKILGFAGSLRVGSYNKALLRAATELLPDSTTLEIFDLDGIPPFNQETRDEYAHKGKGIQIKNSPIQRR